MVSPSSSPPPGVNQYPCVGRAGSYPWNSSTRPAASSSSTRPARRAIGAVTASLVVGYVIVGARYRQPGRAVERPEDHECPPDDRVHADRRARYVAVEPEVLLPGVPRVV